MAQKKNNSKSRSSKKNNNLLFTAACVALGLLVILIIFLVKKDQIFSNLKETAFFDKVIGTTPEVIEKHEVLPAKDKNTVQLKNDTITIKIEQEEEPDPVVENTSASVTMDSLKEEKTPAVTETKPAAASSAPTATSTPKKETSKKEEPKKETPVVNTDVQLCFVLIDGDGSVVRKLIKRSVPKNDSPLTNSINLLLKGPDTTKSAEKNCMTVIPKGTKLLGAKVTGGVAYLSFNDTLEFNEYGVEGIIHSLEQIVYTATSFSTVSSVQILINGEKKDYLGEEGQWIGSPLSRNNF